MRDPKDCPRCGENALRERSRNIKGSQDREWRVVCLACEWDGGSSEEYKANFNNGNTPKTKKRRNDDGNSSHSVPTT